jgi:hypothetical protein
LKNTFAAMAKSIEESAPAASFNVRERQSYRNVILFAK